MLPRQKTFDRIYADAITTFHFFWLFLVFGGMIAVLFYPPYALTQIVVMSVTIAFSIPFHYDCPLTLLEERLRRAIDPDYRNNRSFATTYFNKIFKTRVSVRTMNATIVVLYIFSYTVAILDLLAH